MLLNLQLREMLAPFDLGDPHRRVTGPIVICQSPAGRRTPGYLGFGAGAATTGCSPLHKYCQAMIPVSREMKAQIR